MGYKKYTIGQGDTLSKIAQRHDMTWRALYNFDGGTGTSNRNRLRTNEPNKVYPGEIILVPDSNSAPAKPAPAKPGKKGSKGNVYAPKVFAPSPATVTRTIKVVEVNVHDGKEHTKQPDSSRRQYVNLDNEDIVEHGRRIRLKARYEEKLGSQTKPLAGETIHWRARPGPSNKKGLINQLQAGFDSAGSGTLEKEVTTDADGWTPVVDFYVSRYGGDVFRLIAADKKIPQHASPANGESAGTYEVWRELHYELDCMRRPNGATYTNRANTTGMESNLAQAFLETQHAGSDDSPAHQRVLRTAEAGDWTEKIRQGSSWHRKKLYYHLVLVDTIVSGSKEVTLTHNLSAGTNTIEIPASKYTLDPREWFIDAKFWQPHMGHTAIMGDLDYTDLDEANFTLTEGGSITSGTDHYLLTIDFPESGFFEEGYKPSERAYVRLKVQTWNLLSGVQVGPATVVGIRWRERAFSGNTLANSTLGTMTHEPGHAMGLAATTLPDGSACGTTYHKNGHHCNNNSNTCVMYESNTRSRRTVPCNNCADALRGRDLSALPVEGDDSYV
jgi:LysM repeat protein